MSSRGQSPKSTGSQHETFTAWSKERGVTISAVLPARIPGRGLGIVAERRIEAGEELINVPATALLTERSIPATFRRDYTEITIHGLLAAFLASGHPQLEQYQPWAATWPTPSDLQECMPMLWPAKIRMRADVQLSPTKSCSLMPPAMGCGAWAHPSLMVFRDSFAPGLLAKQETNFRRDLEIVRQTNPAISIEWYKYCWLIVNTRSFYYELPGLKEKRPKKDCLVMCPFVDLFNHAGEGCHVTFDDNDYTVTADRPYEPGEEIFVSYGSHSNDFLLVEYGFILENNKWDYVPIDDMLVPDILGHKSRRNKLDRVGYQGKYALNGDGVCHRTQVAIRALLLGNKDFMNFVKGQEVSDDRDEARADEFIASKILKIYKWEAEQAIQALERLDDEETQTQKRILRKRWRQIMHMVDRAEEVLIARDN